MKHRLFTIFSVLSLLLCVSFVAFWRGEMGVHSVSLCHRKYSVMNWSGELRISTAELIWPPPADPEAPIALGRRNLVAIPCWFSVSLAAILPTCWCWGVLRRWANRWIAPQLAQMPSAPGSEALPRELPIWFTLVMMGVWFSIVGFVISTLGPASDVDNVKTHLMQMQVICLQFGIPASLLAAAWAVARTNRARLRVAGGLCAYCGYDLRASTERCPECGMPMPLRQASA